MSDDTPRRFESALAEAQAAWAAADHELQAALAGCDCREGRVTVPLFGTAHLVDHPSGRVLAQAPGGESAEAGGKPVHASIAILLLHYLLHADGSPPAGSWSAFRELPGGLFYASAFAAHAEAALAEHLWATADPAVRLTAVAGRAAQLGGRPLDLADVSYAFTALPRLPLAVLLWEGDEELPGEARILFDAAAAHYLPTEDLSGLGEWLARALCRS